MKNLQPLQSILFPKPYSLVDYTVQEIAMIGTSFQTQVNTENALFLRKGSKKFIHQFMCTSILVYSSVTKVLRSITKIWTPLLFNSITPPTSMDTIGI